jgi:hypothetical protein
MTVPDRKLPGGGCKVGFRRVLPLAPRPREGPLTEPTAGVQPWPRERVLMPQSCPSRDLRRTAELGGERSFAPRFLVCSRATRFTQAYLENLGKLTAIPTTVR